MRLIGVAVHIGEGLSNVNDLSRFDRSLCHPCRDNSPETLACRGSVRALAAQCANKAIVLEHGGAVVTRALDGFRIVTGNRLVGRMVRHLDFDIRARGLTGFEACIFPGVEPPAATTDNEFFVELLGKHIECKLTTNPIVVLDNDQGVVIDIRAFFVVFKVEKINGLTAARKNPIWR